MKYDLYYSTFIFYLHNAHFFNSAKTAENTDVICRTIDILKRCDKRLQVKMGRDIMYPIIKY